MSQITISDALNWKVTLQARYNELVALRNQNSNTTTTRYGANADKPVETKVLYNVISYKTITTLAKEIRLLDSAIKTANSTILVPNYDQNDDVLGELVPV